MEDQDSWIVAAQSDAFENALPEESVPEEIVDEASATASVGAVAPVTFPRSKLEPAVRWVWAIGGVIGLLPMIVGLFVLDHFVIPTPSVLLAAAVAVVLIPVVIWAAFARYGRWSWELTERDLVMEFGIVVRVVRTVPRVRIQHVDVSSGPFDRMLGLVSMSVYTAGTREADARIPGLATSQASDLRAALIGS